MLTQDYLKSILHYNPDTGIFTWAVSNNQKIKVGDIAGTHESSGYIRIRINGKGYRAHRLAWLYMKGVWPKEQIDHDDRVKHNNSWNNLNQATNQENQKNKNKQKNNTTGVTGVFWHTRDKKWTACININGRLKQLIASKDKFEAICTRKSAENKHGYHEYHGRPTAGEILWAS